MLLIELKMFVNSTGSGGTSSSVFVSHVTVDDCKSASCWSVCSTTVAAVFSEIGSVKTTAKSMMKISRVEEVWCRLVMSDERNEESEDLKRSPITALCLFLYFSKLTSAKSKAQIMSHGQGHEVKFDYMFEELFFLEFYQSINSDWTRSCHSVSSKTRTEIYVCVKQKLSRSETSLATFRQNKCFLFFVAIIIDFISLLLSRKFGT